MSLKRVLDTLASYGLKQTDAQVYIFLAKKGPHTGKSLSAMLRMPKWQVYQCLRTLKAKGIVITTFKRPTLFSAISFEKVIDLVVQAKIEEAQLAQESTARAFSDWKFTIKENSTK